MITMPLPAPAVGREPDPEADLRERVAAACTRIARFLGTFTDPRVREALGVARAYAAGRATLAALRGGMRLVTLAADEARARANGSVWTFAAAGRVAAADAESRTARRIVAEFEHALDPAGCRCRPVTPRADSAWLTGDVVSLARHIAGTGQFDLLPILADALQDAGCDNAELLDHCRGRGPHVRGCWVIELLLGKR